MSDQPTDRTTDQPSDRADQPSDRTDQPTSRPTEPTSRPAERPNRPADQPTDRADQPTDRTTDQPTDRTDQPTDRADQPSAGDGPDASPAPHPDHPTTQLVDPRSAGPRPPFPQGEQEGRGSEAQLRPQPDSGEESYVGGSGRLAGLAALITGADSGIGRAVAIAFAREGADVAVGFLDSDEDAAETCRIVREAGRRAIELKGDISDEATCGRLVERAVAELGHLDVLVNNAAYQEPHPSLEEVTTEEWERHLRTNVTAPFWLTRAALPHLQPGASIINTTSIQAEQPSPDILPYATTKGALATFTKGLALQLASRGIRVNAVAPGPVWTPLIAVGSRPEKVPVFGQNSPFGRPAQPVELAGVYVFLASPDATYVTGAVYPVTGGELMAG